MNADKDFALDWLKKAENDLKAAQLILAAKDGPLDTACFHAQQVVEKSLKGMLTLHSRPFPRVHVLQLLLDLLTDIYPALEQFREQFVILSTYAVEARYPGDYYEPEHQEAKDAVAIAETLLSLAKKQITD